MSATPNGLTQTVGAQANIQTSDELPWTEYAWRQVTANQSEGQRLRANSALPADAWNTMDEAVYDTQENVLTVVQDLLNAGLRTNVDIRNKTIEWQVLDDSHSAQVDMDVESAEEEDNVSWGLRGAPLPIVHDDFSIGWRDRGADGGQNLDTLNATAASRAVNETLEDLVLNGWDRTIQAGNDSYSLYGLTNHPDINTGTRGDWAASTGNMRSDIRAMINTLKDDNNMRPGGTGYWLYLSTDLEDHLNDIDDDGSGDMLARDRIENLSGLSRISATDYLPDGSALMFRPTRDVIDLAVARELTTIQWEDPTGFRDHYKVMASMTPRVKSTKTGQSGVVLFN